MSNALERYPDTIKKIKEEIDSRNVQCLLFDHLKDNWREHAEKAAQVIPEIQIKNGGEALFLGKLSPGCNACKNGEWDCYFITMECNLACAFCWRPLFPKKNHYGSVLTSNEDMLPQTQTRNLITGTSISGGEPFLDPERLFEWVKRLKSTHPKTYLWIYTNGLLVQKTHILRLAELGLNELRFNMAASGYSHPVVLKNLANASQYLPVATVEIPAIPEDRELLMTALQTWSSLGIRHLNLHELVYEPGTPSGFMAGKRKIGSFGDGHIFEYHPLSRELTLSVMQKVYLEQLPVSVNDCSLHSKFCQLKGRRRQLAHMVASPHELFNDEGLLESCVAYNETTATFFHPSSLIEMKKSLPDLLFARLRRAVPLYKDEPSIWLQWHELE
jgi:uncharacterized protein